MLRRFSLVLLLLTAACSNAFVVEATYEPASGRYQAIEVRATGERERADDIADAGQVVLTLVTKSGERTVLPIAVERGSLYDAGADPPERLEEHALRVLFHEADVEPRREELVEILAIVERAAMGPKAGVPDTEALTLVSMHATYVRDLER